MLKWAVYGKKNQETKPTADIERKNEAEYSNGPYATRALRRSLDAPTVKKSKKPSRYQRRSLGSAVRKSNLKSVDKENVNFIGNTPNYFKEGFITKKADVALKDVSNITSTPSTPVLSNHNRIPREEFHRGKYSSTRSREAVPPDLPPTPPTYSKRIRDAKKRKLEMSCTSNNSESFEKNSNKSKSENRRKSRGQCIELNQPQLTHSQSVPSLNELSERLNVSTASHRNSIALCKYSKNSQRVSTTKISSNGLVEIEYDKDIVINCTEKPIADCERNNVKHSTLPIFGHHIFMENPLYFNKKHQFSIRALKRTRKKSNEFESSFKSPSVDKKDVHTLVTDACSPIFMTPLSVKLGALRFSAMSSNSIPRKDNTLTDSTDSFPKIVNPFVIHLRDEETSAEMENKFILGKDSTNETESTNSASQMGDSTLERMIEDIIKSAKKVKTKRKLLTNAEGGSKTIDPLNKTLFVNPQSESKFTQIREAKHVSLSRENSISPRSSPLRKRDRGNADISCKAFAQEMLSCSYIIDDRTKYNEREVKTPEYMNLGQDIPLNDNVKKSINRSHSMSVVRSNKSNEYASFGSTPDLSLSELPNSNTKLKRQRCVRRKKSCLSNEGSWRKRQSDKKSFLRLDVKIPSPSSDLNELSFHDPLSESFNCFVASCGKKKDDETISDRRNTYQSNISHSSVMCNDMDLSENTKLFGLTLKNGVPSPITPVINKKRHVNNLSEEGAYKSTKTDEEFNRTPVIEYKSSRRCLTFSSEEGSFSSCEEKRRSVASYRLERSTDKLLPIKGIIDINIVTKNDVVDVHVVRCRDLQRPCGKTDEINAYAKVVISGLNENLSLPPLRSIFQRTSVLYGKREPEFQRHLVLPLPVTISDHQAIHVSVWHRDKKYRRSEFLGCVSFPLKDAIKDDICGSYYLQSQSQVSGRSQVAHAPAPAHSTTDAFRDRCLRDTDISVTGNARRKMATDNVEGTSTNEDTAKENHYDRGVSSNGPACSGGSSAAQAQAAAAALQREADEHLFLRYLELDPPDDPSAPRRTQRHGRTPFTTSRKVVRGTSSGYGFTVVWTRPPRVERVVAGGSAERAGLRAGDYLVFVGNRNVVTAPEDEVRHLVKAAGQTLILETFRRVPQNGVVGKPRVASQAHIMALSESSPAAVPRSPRNIAPPSPAPASATHRPPTACSSTSQSFDRRKLHLPQVTFSKEVGNGIIV